MKLLSKDEKCWKFLLNAQETVCLQYLLQGFPLAEAAPARLTKTDTSAPARERQALLEEFLTEHRRELEKQAQLLLREEKWPVRRKVQQLHLDPAEREALIQILNDIRVTCWHALGQPETLEDPPATASPEQMQQHGLMQLAGFFEYTLIEPEVSESPKP